MNTSSSNKDSKLINEAYARIYLQVDEEFQSVESPLPEHIKGFLERYKNSVSDYFFGEDEKGKFVACQTWEPYGDDGQIDEYYKYYFSADRPLWISKEEFEALKH